MDAVAITIPDDETPRARLALLLEHFSKLADDREPWRVMYPLKEVLLLVTCATIAFCDGFRRHRRLGQTSSRLFCGAFRNSIMGYPVRALGALPSSTGSTRSYSAAVSTAGSRRGGQRHELSQSSRQTSLEPTTSAKGSKPCIRSALMPQMQG